MNIYRIFLCCILSLISVGNAYGHALAPSLLEIVAEEGRYDVLWKTPKKTEKGVNLLPRLPEVCGKPINSSAQVVGMAYVIKYSVQCSQALEGQTVKIDDLSLASTNVVLRYIDNKGIKNHWLLSNDKTEIQIPLQKNASTIFVDYLVLGVKHLISGIDHVLFVIALMLLVQFGKKLIIAITAFTLGHSITLALSALDLVSLPQQPIEILIAITIMLVASDVIVSRRKGQTWLQRHPGLVTCFFGLIHGLGFAGVLSEVGLPGSDKVMALFAFNIGIEVGQLGIVFAWLVLVRLISIMVRKVDEIVVSDGPFAMPVRLQQALAYSIGCVGAYWVFDRSFTLLGGGI